MASVSGSGTGRVAQTKDAEHRSRYSQAEKRHRQEVQNIRQQHVDEVKRLQAEYDRRMTAMRESSRGALSEKDRYYQGQIESLQKAYQDRMKKLSEDFEQKITISNKTYATELERQKTTSESQRDLLRRNYDSQIQKKDEQYREYVSSSLEAQNNAMKEKKQELQMAHEKELKAVNRAHVQELQGGQREYNSLRTTKNKEISDLKRAAEFKEEMLSKNFQATLKSDREYHDAVTEIQKEQHTEGIQRVKDKYQNAIQDYIASGNESREAFKDDVSRRQNNEMSGLRSKIREQKASYEGKILRSDRGSKLEIQHLRDQMRDSNQKLQESAEIAVQEMQVQNTRDIEGVNKKNHEMMNKLNRRYRSDIQALKEKQEENLTEQVFTQKAANTALKTNFEERIDVLTDDRFRSEEKIRSYYEAALKQAREGHQDELREMNEKLSQEKRTLINSFKERFQHVDKSNREKLSDMQRTYEAKIAELKETITSDRRNLVNQNRKESKTLTKKHMKDLEATKLQADIRLSQLKEQHAEAMERVENRHRREMEQLVTQQTKV